MPEEVDSPLCHAPIASEGARFEVAYFPTAVAFDAVVRLVGSVAPAVVEAVAAVALAAALEVSADHPGTELKQNPPIQHMDLPAGHKSSQEEQQGRMQRHMTS
jgi:hypothetical protein